MRTPEPDVLLFNGVVRTQNPRLPVVEAVVVRGDRIAFAGNNADARSFAGPRARRVDLEQGLLLPGFIDDHTHFIWGGRQLLGINIRGCRSVEEFREVIREYAGAHRGRWVTGGSWDQESWAVPLWPTRHIIDDATTDTPVFVLRLDGHVGLANSLALRLAGINLSTPDPVGGTIERDSMSGEPTGLLKDAAMELVNRVIPRPTPPEMLEALRAAEKEAHRNGITSIHDVTLPEQYELYSRLDHDQDLFIRIYARLPIENRSMLIDRSGKVEPEKGSHFLRARSVKAFSDGSLGANTAWFFEPYCNDPSSTGLPMEIVRNGALERWALEADRLGLQLSIHAIGDRANHHVLTLFDTIARRNPAWDRRFRVEHAQHVRPGDIGLFAALGVVVSAQPYHAVEDGVWAEKRIGASRLEGTYAFRSFLEAGVRVCFGSDWPVAPLNALAGIDAAVSRRTVDGKNPDGWIPSEKLSVEQAIRCYTIDGAYAEFEENEKGTIETGKLADLVMLSHDVASGGPDAVRAASVEMTILNGRTVYDHLGTDVVQ